ncbi:MAG: XcyI family restriction endonuclease [Gemmatales bacterium]|nr:XcyI family restriction endonuclease [Gemmatales bacterium]MDW8174759.1 XcyI family restriction endonuclease [Gemmatales bacterium]
MGRRKQSSSSDASACSSPSSKPAHEEFLVSIRARSRFFAGKIKESDERLRIWFQVMNNCKCDWPDQSTRAEWGISDKAFEKVMQDGTPPHFVFVHPHLVGERRDLLDYYRALACLSQKGLSQLTRGLQQQERQLYEVKILHQLLSALVEQTFTFSEQVARSFIMAQLGSEIQGSWVNEIGQRAADKVWSMIREFVQAQNYVLKTTKQSLALPNGITLTRKSEPDIEARDSSNILLAAIEINGSLDPAGAQTRYGEAKKSFEKARQENPRCITNYIVSCLTGSVKNLIAKDGQVSYVWDLLELGLDEQYRTDKLKELFVHILRV